MKQSIVFVFWLGTLAFAAAAQVPVVAINGASFQQAAPVAPGSYAQVWGDYQGFPTSNTTARPLPTTLAGVQVLVNGTASPIYAVSPVVVAFTVPQSVSPGRHPIQVTNAGTIVGAGTIDIVASFSGVFFRRLEDGTDAGGVRRGADLEFALPGTPASRGEAVTIALTGQGNTVENPVGEGEAPSDANSTTTVTPRVFMNGVEAQVTFSGLMPFFPGLWQINAMVPNESFLSGPVSLVVTYNGIPSNQVIFWVAE